MKCPLCGYEFNIEKATSACKKCPFTQKCGFVLCPNCSYESLQTPELLKNSKKMKAFHRTQMDRKKNNFLIYEQE